MGELQDIAIDATIGGALAGTGYGVSKAATSLFSKLSVETDYGHAYQSLRPSALKLRAEVAKGQQVYRAGNFGHSAAVEGQFWAPQSPLTPGYAQQYGLLGSSSVANMDFIIGGQVRSNTSFITRPAPGVGQNFGGALEIVTQPGGVQAHYFHMQ